MLFKIDFIIFDLCVIVLTILEFARNTLRLCPEKEKLYRAQDLCS